MPVITRLAPAKVNLTLSVGRAEPPTLDGAPNPRSGWHPLASWMVCLDLADTVTVRPEAASSLQLTWAADAPQPSPIDWPAERDLAARAHKLLERRVASPLPCTIEVVKRVPVGGGLGGGSSDAAATLMAVRDAFALELRDADLALLGAELGSDVPFFVRSGCGPAILHGYGERIEETPAVRGAALLLIVPPFGCPTPTVYHAFDRVCPSAGVPATERVRAIAAAPFDASTWFNDLEPAAETVEPRLAPVRATAERLLQRRVMMTGSGSTLIAPAASQDDPAALAAAIGGGVRVLRAAIR